MDDENAQSSSKIINQSLSNVVEEDEDSEEAEDQKIVTDNVKSQNNDIRVHPNYVLQDTMTNQVKLRNLSIDHSHLLDDSQSNIRGRT